MRNATIRSKVTRFRSGNAVLDMALIMPLLLALVLGMAEYGYALYVKHSLQSAAREGARAAIVSGADAAAVQREIDSAMQAAGFATTKYSRPPVIEYSTDGQNWSTSWSSAVAGNSIRVSVQATWGTIGVRMLPFTYPGSIPPAKVMTGATTMRKEG